MSRESEAVRRVNSETMVIVAAQWHTGLLPEYEVDQRLRRDP